MAKALKHMLASQLQADIKDSPGLLVVDPGGMTVESSMAFRRDLRENAGGAKLRIIHNRTARVAFANLKYKDENDSLAATLTGANAIIYGGDGPISIAKIVRDWRRKEKQLEVKAAVADGEVLPEEDAKNLADMPSKEDLLTKLAYLLQSPIRRLAVALNSPVQNLASVLGQVAKAEENKES